MIFKFFFFLLEEVFLFLGMYMSFEFFVGSFLLVLMGENFEFKLLMNFINLLILAGFCFILSMIGFLFFSNFKVVFIEELNVVILLCIYYLIF